MSYRVNPQGPQEFTVHSALLHQTPVGKPKKIGRIIYPCVALAGVAGIATNVYKAVKQRSVDYTFYVTSIASLGALVAGVLGIIRAPSAYPQDVSEDTPPGNYGLNRSQVQRLYSSLEEWDHALSEIGSFQEPHAIDLERADQSSLLNNQEQSFSLLQLKLQSVSQRIEHVKKCLRQEKCLAPNLAAQRKALEDKVQDLSKELESLKGMLVARDALNLDIAEHLSLVTAQLTRGETQSPASRSEAQSPASRSEAQSPASRLEAQSPASRLEAQSPASRSEAQSPASRLEAQSPVSNVGAGFSAANAALLARLQQVINNPYNSDSKVSSRASSGSGSPVSGRGAQALSPPPVIGSAAAAAAAGRFDLSPVRGSFKPPAGLSRLPPIADTSPPNSLPTATENGF